MNSADPRAAASCCLLCSNSSQPACSREWSLGQGNISPTAAHTLLPASSERCREPHGSQCSSLLLSALFPSSPPLLLLSFSSRRFSSPPLFLFSPLLLSSSSGSGGEWRQKLRCLRERVPNTHLGVGGGGGGGGGGARDGEDLGLGLHLVAPRPGPPLCEDYRCSSCRVEGGASTLFCRALAQPGRNGDPFSSNAMAVTFLGLKLPLC